MIKAAIFDLDGVIVDTAKYHYLAWRRLAGELGFEFDEVHNERLKGVSRMRSLEILLEVGGLMGRFTAEQMTAMADRKNGWYLEYVAAMTPAEILPGVLEFLDSVRAAGVRVALGSASRSAKMVLELVGIADRFDAVIDGNLVSRAKPDPEVFVLGADTLGVQYADCMVFEDAAAGVEAAHRAGMRCVGVGSAEMLSAADMVISTFVGLTLDQISA